MLFCSDIKLHSIGLSIAFFVIMFFYPIFKSYDLDCCIKALNNEANKEYKLYYLKFSRIFFTFSKHKKGLIAKAAFWFSIITYAVNIAYISIIILLISYDFYWSYVLRFVFMGIYFLYFFIEGVVIDYKYYSIWKDIKKEKKHVLKEITNENGENKRKLIIQRKKTIVASLMKAYIYIQDAAGELILDGYNCKRLGFLKKNELAEFYISSGCQILFIVYDKFFPQKFHTSYLIPQGIDNVKLYIKAKRSISEGNPFEITDV